jgi:putative transcriptional regulator
MTEKETKLADALIESLQEVAAWQRGELELDIVDVDTMPPARIKSIRKKAARSVADFERRFGIPVATMNNWEQGRRKPAASDRLLLKMIDRDAALVEQVAQAG